MLERLEEMILDFQGQTLETGVPRRLDYETVKKKAFVCIGVRRCGKSTLLYQIIDRLVGEGVDRENILYVDFFDDRLHDLKHGNLGLVLDAYFAIYPQKKGSEIVHCFFDEIQMMQGWEPFVDRILRTERVEVYISGSSAKLLASEIATEMRGRSLSWELFPFSFPEFLEACGVVPEPRTSKIRLVVERAFGDYWTRGGFPEILDVSDRIRVMIHQEYFKTILLRDIVERHDIRHPKAVVDLAHKLVDNCGSLYSVNRLTTYLKSLGHRTSKAFVGECVSWFEDAYFLFSMRIFDASYSRQNVNPKKVYCVDHALIRSVSLGILVNAGHLLENIVFVNLRRQGVSPNYYRTRGKKEVDFIYRDASGDLRLVQVCESIVVPSTRKREIAAIEEAMKEQRIDHGTIVTRTESEKIELDNGTIEVVPAWKYLLTSTRDEKQNRRPR